LATTDVSICNSALSKLGAERISSLSNATKEGKLCKEQYAKRRDALLQSHPWNFAVTRRSLAESATYTPPFEYEKAFVVPNDVLRVLVIDANIPLQIGEKKWAVEIDPDTNQKVLLSNVDSVAIKYIKSVPEAFFTPLFSELLALDLAKDWAWNLTQSNTVLQLVSREFEDKLKAARSYDAQEGSPPQVDADDWLLARLSGGPGFLTTSE